MIESVRFVNLKLGRESSPPSYSRFADRARESSGISESSATPDPFLPIFLSDRAAERTFDTSPYMIR